MNHLVLKFAAASALAGAYSFMTLELSRKCGCLDVGNDLATLSECVKEAIATRRCSRPDHRVETVFDQRDFCVENGLGDVGDVSTLLLPNPGSDMHYTTGLNLGFGAGCKIESVQLGNVSNKQTVTAGGTCEPFTKTRDLRFHQNNESNMIIPFLSFFHFNSDEGNALLLTGRDCDYGEFWDAKAYGSWDGRTLFVSSDEASAPCESEDASCSRGNRDEEAEIEEILKQLDAQLLEDSDSA